MNTKLMTKHPLIGKLIRIDDENHEYHSISRFVASLGDGLMLAERLSPHTGEKLVSSHIVVLGLVAQDDNTELYNCFADYQQVTQGPQKTENIVKLVPPAPAAQTL